MGERNNSLSMDLKTPRNVHLSGFYKRSFAYYTIKERMPVNLTQTIDLLSRYKEEIGKEYGNEASEELKIVIGELSKLKYEIQTNKPLRNLQSNASDVAFYNDYLASQASEYGHPTYFNSIWLHAECYMYRRIRETFELTEHLKDYDPFRKQKENSFFNSLQHITFSAQYFLDNIDKESDLKNMFIALLKLNLWGNKCDLSLSNGIINTNAEELDMSQLDKNILCDHSNEVWDVVSDKSNSSNIIDIVFDNAGYELFTDLCLADFIITKGLSQKIRLYVKSIPWFVSDVMKHDFHWLIENLKSHKVDVLKKLGERWHKYVTDKTWILQEHNFWTLPVDFTYMERYAPDLYKQLSEAKLIIFKGDLNYRKLFGEKNWDPTTPIEEALQGFHPSKLCSLRTVKADIICGLEPGVFETIEERDEKWMTTGDYGLIQFCNKIRKIN